MGSKVIEKRDHAILKFIFFWCMNGCSLIQSRSGHSRKLLDRAISEYVIMVVYGKWFTSPRPKCRAVIYMYCRYTSWPLSRCYIRSRHSIQAMRTNKWNGMKFSIICQGKRDNSAEYDLKPIRKNSLIPDIAVSFTTKFRAEYWFRYLFT